ncbi:lectin [Mucilaginibacter celer]|uniref:Lectin n=1 Tax=Mucilaginibacter celer TaxID=2305508 RepID=A0A494VMY7_9SPHI|nr:lectin [Mucilaginibacter celer]AYL94340.1 lectin [Mucilaginibacter celer]
MKKYFLLLFIIMAGCAKKDLQKMSSSDLVTSRRLNTGSTGGDVIGHAVVGYQGWFSCPGDGANEQIWWHWTGNNAAPSIGNMVKSWPDVREYTTLFTTGLPAMGNGQPTRLFSSYTDQTVDTHFRWMQENGIEVAALQRFHDYLDMRTAITAKVRTAAEAHNVKFYIMYDISGWTTFQNDIKTDWTDKIARFTSSPAYAVQNGKPVVCIWGLGFADRDQTPAAELDVVNWFRSKGCYVIGGVPHEWRDYIKPGDKNFEPVFKALDMISPWMVGAIGNNQQSDFYYTNYNQPDLVYCKANNIAYQPCVLPGDLSAKHRVHGDFMWHQFYNMTRLGAQGLYISMFDEYNEANQIAKTAEDDTMQPSGLGLLALNEDGVKCSADYYMRLTNDGTKMFKGLIPLTLLRPTEPVVGSGPMHLPPYNKPVKFIGYNNLWVGGNNGNGPMYCNVPHGDIWETFTVTDAGNGKVALQSMGKFVSSENGSGPMTCNRTAVGEWERFDYLINDDGSVSLRGNNGKYVTAEDGIKPMICDRTLIGPWERFAVN